MMSVALVFSDNCTTAWSKMSYTGAKREVDLSIMVAAQLSIM